jgi:hypothetical protein
LPLWLRKQVEELRSMFHHRLSYFLVLMASFAIGGGLGMKTAAVAQEVVEIIIKDHKFSPTEIHVPAHQATTINIKNQDPLAEEFDSTTLKIDKVIGGAAKGRCVYGPLSRAVILLWVSIIPIPPKEWLLLNNI